MSATTSIYGASSSKLQTPVAPQEAGWQRQAPRDLDPYGSQKVESPGYAAPRETPPTLQAGPGSPARMASYPLSVGWVGTSSDEVPTLGAVAPYPPLLAFNAGIFWPGTQGPLLE